MNSQMSGKLARSTILLFVFHTVVSALFSVTATILLHPGKVGSKPDFIYEQTNSGPSPRFLDTFLDMIRNIFPDNFVQACFQLTQTTYVVKNASTNATEFVLDSAERVLVMKNSMNTLGLIMCFVAIGLSIAKIGKEGKPLVDVIVAADKVVMSLLRAVIWLTPFGVASLVCERLAVMSDLSIVAASLGSFMVMFLGICTFQFGVILPATYFLFCRRNLYPIWGKIIPVFVTAFATDSSFVALPVTMRYMEEKAGINQKISKFVFSLGAGIHKNGAVMFLTAVPIFLAQMNGVTPTITQIITATVTGTFMSIAAGAIPSGSLAVMFLVVGCIPDVPLSDIGMLFITDWLLSRYRTINNILGDCCTAAIIQARMDDDDFMDDTESESVERGASVEIEAVRDSDKLVLNDNIRIISTDYQNGNNHP